MTDSFKMFVLNKYSFVYCIYLFFTFFILSVTNTTLKPRHGANLTLVKSHGQKPVIVSDEFERNSVTNDKNKEILKDKYQEEKKFYIPLYVKPVDVGRLDLRVGKIVNATKHPNADNLYVETIDVGEEQPRQVVSGLVKFVPLEELTGRMVVLLCNLKPSKLRGILSEGMIMCASSEDKVEILKPPQGSVPGDLIKVHGYTRSPDKVLKFFEKIAKDLKTNNYMVATYKELPWVILGKGLIKAPSLSNANIK